MKEEGAHTPARIKSGWPLTRRDRVEGREFMALLVVTGEKKKGGGF